jgi:hypothetical protein
LNLRHGSYDGGGEAVTSADDGWVIETSDQIFYGCAPENPPTEASWFYVREILKRRIEGERNKGRGLLSGETRLYWISHKLGVVRLVER